MKLIKAIRPYLIAILLIALSVALRMVFLADLKRGIPYLTFYPTVMVAAILGGLYTGLFATILSALLCYYWIQQGQLSHVEWLAFFVFILSCTLMSAVAEAMRRAREKTKRAKEEAENIRPELREQLYRIIRNLDFQKLISLLEEEKPTNS